MTFRIKKFVNQKKLFIMYVLTSGLEKTEKAYLWIKRLTGFSQKPSDLAKIHQSINQSINYRMLDIVEDTKDIWPAMSSKGYHPDGETRPFCSGMSSSRRKNLSYK